MKAEEIFGNAVFSAGFIFFRYVLNGKLKP